MKKQSVNNAANSSPRPSADTAMHDASDRLESADHRSILVPSSKFFPVAMELAASDRQRHALYELRHESFVSAGWIEPRATGELVDEFDELPTTLLIQAVRDGTIVATLRIATRMGPAPYPQLPCELEFRDEIDAIVGRHGPRVAEYSRASVGSAIANTSFRTTLYASLVRTALIVSHAIEIDYAVAAVHARLSMFYRSMIGFRHIATSRSYGEIEEPTHLLGGSREALFARARQRSRFFRINEDDIERARSAIALHRPTLLAEA